MGTRMYMLGQSKVEDSSDAGEKAELSLYYVAVLSCPDDGEAEH